MFLFWRNLRVANNVGRNKILNCEKADIAKAYKHCEKKNGIQISQRCLSLKIKSNETK